MISGCNSSAHVLNVVGKECIDAKVKHKINIFNTRFENNSFFGKGQIINAANSECVSLKMDNTAVVNNECLKAHCAVLASDNVLNDILLISNRGQNTSSVFFGSKVSQTVATQIVSGSNEIRNFQLSFGTLKLIDSRFNGEAVEGGSGDRRSSLLGGIIMAKNSTASIRNCTFKNNSGLMGGVLWGSGSQIKSVSSQFIQNEAESGGAIYLEKNSSLILLNSSFAS